MEDLPYGRGIRGLARLVPGLSPTQFDVGGNTVGGSTTTGARSYGRTGGELIKFDGVVWDQFFGDYNTYDQVQVSAAAKGAEAQSPGVTLSFVIKSGSNKFSGNYLFALAGRRVPGQQRHAGAARAGLRSGQQQVHALQRHQPRSRRADHPRQAVVLRRLRLQLFGTADSRLHLDRDRRAGRVLHAARQPDAQADVSDVAEQQVRAHRSSSIASGSRIATPARSCRWKRRRTRSRGRRSARPLKFTRIMSQRMTFDASFNRSGYWWPDYAWTDDVRTMDLTTTQTRGAFLELRRDPVRWGYNGTWSLVHDHRRA